MKKNIPKNKRGQTLVEFAMVSVIFVFMIFITFNAILAFCVQQYLSYGVFMAARAYQAAGATADDQSTAAQQVLAQFVVGSSGTTVQPGDVIKFQLYKRALATVQQVVVPLSAPAYGPGATPDGGANYIGLKFSVPLMAGMSLGGAVTAQLSSITLEARSYLGREVSQKECYDFFRSFLGKYRLSSAPPEIQQENQKHSSDPYTLYMDDNGC